MNEQHVWQMLDGLGTSLQLTAASLVVGCLLALMMTLTLILHYSRFALGKSWHHHLVHRYAFVGTDLLGVLRSGSV